MPRFSEITFLGPAFIRLKNPGDVKFYYDQEGFIEAIEIPEDNKITVEGFSKSLDYEQHEPRV